MANYREDWSMDARAVLVRSSSRPDIAGRSKQDPAALREKAARYRKLADILFDPRVVDEVQACARELDAEANWIEKRNAFSTRGLTQRYRVGN